MKKKVLYQSDYSLAKTGFGRAAKELLSYLYKTKKYEIVHYSCGVINSNPELERTPWKSIGALPSSREELEILNRDPNSARMASYGALLIDKVVKEEKPDVYIAAQDIWGVDFAIDKPWFKKINSIIWTTLDSLPILPSAINAAKKTKNYWIWSDFATKELTAMGYPNVKTVHGPINEQFFYRMDDNARQKLRAKNRIPRDAFIIGYVFRNQLRKSVPNLLEGYAIWKRNNPHIKNAFLLFHTHWGEGWNIPKLSKEYNIDLKEILTTYVCKNCGQYEIKSFCGLDIDCPLCGEGKSQTTANVSTGVSEEQLNEVYNLMDVYCHPFTSGGQEIPIQEAKLAELITLVTNYSCGEELCCEGAASLELEWSEYREHGTEFIKASTKPGSIAKQLNKVYNMSPQKRKEYGEKAREWTIRNYSIKNIGKIFEDFIDNSEKINYDFKFDEMLPNPNAEIEDLENSSEWIKSLYHNILNRPNVDELDDGHKYWMQEISKGTSRKSIENYFREVARKETEEKKIRNFEDLLDSDDKGKRILYVIPEDEKDVFLSTAIFPSIKETYKNHNLYVATKPENFEILISNPNIHKVINYIPEMDNIFWLEGKGSHEGYFDIAFLPHISAKRSIDYIHNGHTKLQLELK